MENSPPGIQAIPSGPERAGAFLFSTVGAKLLLPADGPSAVTTDAAVLVAWTERPAYRQKPNPASNTARHITIFSEFDCLETLEALSWRPLFVIGLNSLQSATCVGRQT